jgi:glycosyltransferase involved in cell wall biosynthesis
LGRNAKANVWLSPFHAPADIASAWSRRPDAMKVLLVSSNSSGVGGGERYLVYLARGLCQLGHEVHGLVGTHPYMDSIAGRLSAAGAIVRRERLVALRDRSLRFVSACLDRSQHRKLAGIYREIGPEVVHVNQQYDEDGLDLILAARRASLPLVGTIHLPMCRGKLQRPLGRARTAWMKAWYHCVSYTKILPSAETAQEFGDFYACQDTVFQVDNATFEGGMPDAPAAPRPPGWNGAAPVIGFVGRLEDQKDPLLLVRAWVLLRTALHEAKLLLVGDGSLRAEIERVVSEEGLTRDLHITGWAADVRPWLKLMDVCALTSHFEGMPLSLIEAACDGLRIAAVLGPGVPGVLSHAGWAAPTHRDAKQLADAIQRALASDPPAPSQLDAARAYFSVSRMARDVVAVYETAIDGFRGRGHAR